MLKHEQDYQMGWCYDFDKCCFVIKEGKREA